MVHMGVGNDDMRDRFARKRGFDVFDMLFDHRAGVYDGDFALADDIRVGTDMGERTGVLGNDAPDAGGDFLRRAVFERHFLFERNIG